MIVVYDGVCKVCNTSVQFLMPRDPQRRLRFVSVQSPAGALLLRRHGYQADDPETMLFLSGGKLHTRSAAVIRIGAALGGVYRLAWLLWLIPAPLRDWAYSKLARNRYRWFGKRESCLLPSAADADRFIDAPEQLPSEYR